MASKGWLENEKTSVEYLTAAWAHTAAPDQGRKRKVTAGRPVQSDQLTGGRLSPTHGFPPLNAFSTRHRTLQTHKDKYSTYIK